MQVAHTRRDLHYEVQGALDGIQSATVPLVQWVYCHMSDFDIFDVAPAAHPRQNKHHRD